MTRSSEWRVWTFLALAIAYLVVAIAVRLAWRNG